jgi:hypothetical protein
METVIRHGAITALESLFAFLRPRYMKRSDERRLFSSWDAIYRRIHEEKLECGAITVHPSDTTELHRSNVVPGLIKEHSTPRSISAVV